MLSLITGVPGSGKTAWLVKQLMTRKDLQNRILIVDGIPDLKISHQSVPEGETIHTWPDWAPDGAVIVIDECQRHFRTRRSGSEVPKYISEFETHRHRGLDFFLLTQNPNLIDQNVRALIEEHRHISKTLLGFRRMLYWNTGGAKNPTARKDISESIASIYKLPKDAFAMYKSAEVHTKIRGKKSKIVYIFPIAIIIVIYLFFFLKHRYYLHTNPKSPESVTHATAAERSAGGAALAIKPVPSGATYNQSEQKKEQQRIQNANYNKDEFKAQNEGQPWTARAYDNQRTVQTMPYPVACVKNGRKCNCYTDQATVIKELSKKQCIDFVDNGIYNPYKDFNNTARIGSTTTPPVNSST